MIFVDTGFLFAMVSTKDEHHHRVLEVLKPYEDRRLSEFLLTTNHVVGETLTMLRGLGHQQAVRMGEQLYGEKLARVHWATREEELEAVDDDADLCAASVIPETSVPAVGLVEGRYALVNGDEVFDTVGSTGETFTMAQTRGCSCAQVLAPSSGDKNGHYKHGCSGDLIRGFIAAHP